MAGFSTDLERKIIPRWRTLDDALKRRELDSTVLPRTPQRATTDLLAQKAIDWLNHQTVGHATDFVGAALTLRREQEAIGAAEFLLQDNLSVSTWAKELAECALTASNSFEKETPNPLTEESNIGTHVKTLRARLRVEPSDPISWVELSRVYTILGRKKKAERSMIVGLQLANNNRFVLRSASRLWVHLGDPERAHHILFEADRTRHDPWLLAAEIAVGSIEGRNPMFIKIARKMFTDGKFSRAHISELASAVATLELNSGNVKKSKKLFRLSLEDPTENSVAQAAWASRKSNAIHFRDLYLTLPNAYEAKSWGHYQKGEWREALEQCDQWESDQPFSSRPSAFASFVAAVALEEYQTSERLAKLGCRASPADFTLLNNLAFAQINLGKFDSARENLSKANRLSLTECNQIVLKATKGFLAFRTGDVVKGRQLYSEARLKALGIKDSRLFALASAFLAIEEVSQKSSNSRTISSRVCKILDREKDPIFRVLEKKLKKTDD